MPIIFVVIIRSVISFLVLLVLVRLIGKQQMSEMTLFDYIVGITIGSIAATISVEVNQNTVATLTGMTIWAVLPFILSYITLKNVWVRKVVEGEPVVVIENGKIQEDRLKRTRLSIDDLQTQLRREGVFELSDVEFALFETNGKLSIQRKSQKRPVTPADLKIPTAYEGFPTTIISDGILLKTALKSLDLSQAWLLHQLEKCNIHDTTEVSLAQLNTQGTLYVDLKGDRPCQTISTKE